MANFGTWEEHSALQKIGSEAEQGRLKEGLAYACKLLESDPLHIGGLTLGSYCLRRLGSPVLSYHLALSGVREVPNEDALWLNLGGAAQELWLLEEAEHAYLEALRHAKSDQHRAVVWLNLSAMYADNGQFPQAEEYCKKILQQKSDHKNARANLGFCQLARRDWVEGWKNYTQVVGGDWLPRVQYKGEPQWNGTPGQTVVVYADQGLGDCINFASMLPDAIASCKKLILECEPKLEHLLKRSFPGIKIYPTRREKGASGVRWDKADRDFDASIPLSQLGQFYRLTDEAFPGTPYIKPCPVRTEMWRKHFDGKEKACIGIAWSGGVARTNARYRQLELEELLPLFRSVDAHWVCLQYKPAGAEIAEFRAKFPDIDLIEYPFATLTPDYDDTAALVAALDHVVCMQTTVGHLAASMGIATTVLIPKATAWRYAGEWDSTPWYGSMRLVRQKEHGKWADEIRSAAVIVAADLPELPADAGGPALDRELRCGGGNVRPNGKQADSGLPSHASA